jgi:hypothetical protein
VRIALVGPAYPDRGGGARHTTELAHRLAAAGHNVIIESWPAQHRTPEGRQSRTPEGRQHPIPEGRQSRTPEDRQSRTPEGRQSRTPEGRQHRTPEGRQPRTPEGRPYPRTYRRLAWYRPDGWLAAGRRLRSADLVIFALLTPAQAPGYLSVLAGLAVGPGRPRTVLICHSVPADRAVTRTLLSHVDTVIVHSAAQSAQARELACDVPIVIARIPPPRQDHLAERAMVPAPRHPDPDPEPYWAAYLHALQVT